MAITLELLEQLVLSEVDNLHLRVDEVLPAIERLEQRTSSLERQVSLLAMAVEDLRVEVRLIKELLPNFATKDELEALLKKYLTDPSIK